MFAYFPITGSPPRRPRLTSGVFCCSTSDRYNASVYRGHPNQNKPKGRHFFGYLRVSTPKQGVAYQSDSRSVVPPQVCTVELLQSPKTLAAQGFVQKPDIRDIAPVSSLLYDTPRTFSAESLFSWAASCTQEFADAVSAISWGAAELQEDAA